MPAGPERAQRSQRGAQQRLINIGLRLPALFPSRSGEPHSRFPLDRPRLDSPDPLRGQSVWFEAAGFPAAGFPGCLWFRAVKVPVLYAPQLAHRPPGRLRQNRVGVLRPALQCR